MKMTERSRRHFGKNISIRILDPPQLSLCLSLLLFKQYLTFVEKSINNERIHLLSCSNVSDVTSLTFFRSYVTLLSEEVGKVPKFIRYFTSPPVDHWDRPTLVTVSDFGCVLPSLLSVFHRVGLWVRTAFIIISLSPRRTSGAYCLHYYQSFTVSDFGCVLPSLLSVLHHVRLRVCTAFITGQILAKVIFSQACVKNSVHRGGGESLTRHTHTLPMENPPRMETPQMENPPTPGMENPPRWRTPPDGEPTWDGELPLGWRPWRLRNTVNIRPVCILLECILVIISPSPCRTSGAYCLHYYQSFTVSD